MGSFGGNLGSTLGSAGTALRNVASKVYQRSGLGDIAAGLQSLFGGEVVPAASEPSFVGPPSPYAAPSPGQGFWRGMTGQNVGGGADVVPPGAQTAGGLGELVALLDKIRQQSGGQMAAPGVGGGGGGAGGGGGELH